MIYYTKDFYIKEIGVWPMSQKNKKNYTESSVYLQRASFVVFVGTLILITVFPLIYHNYYFDILNTKYKFYYCTILIMAAGVLLLCVIPSLITKKENWEMKWKKGLKNINLADLSMLFLLITTVISTLQSDFKYESFWGNEARYNGLFLWLIYGLAYLLITRLLKFKTSLLDFFLLAGILVCLFGITDYFKLDLLHFKVRMRETQRKDFASTIGNINLYTAYVGMVIAIAMTLFTKAKSRPKIIFYYVTMVIAFLAMIMGRSDNGYLALGALFAALPFYLFKTRTGIKRYIVCVATLLTSVWMVSIANIIWSEHVLYLDSVFGIMSRSDKLIYVVLVSWIAVAVMYILDRKKTEDVVGKLPYRLWSAFIIACFVAGIAIFYDANIAGNGARYGSMSDYLVFSDSWGTDRGFVWKLSMNHFKEFSFIRKLFGYGPDTFGILTHYNDFDTMVEYNNTIFESAHNEYIHYLLTIGAVGLGAYVMLLFTSCYEILKKCSKEPYAVAIVFSILAYAAQATVNIAQPIVTPIMFTLLMIGLSACNNNVES